MLKHGGLIFQLCIKVIVMLVTLCDRVRRLVVKELVYLCADISFTSLAAKSCPATLLQALSLILLFLSEGRLLDGSFGLHWLVDVLCDRDFETI